jgi:hypothetical protein
VEAAPIATARWGNQAVAAAASGNRPMPRATTACPLRRPATHSLTTAEATLVALATTPSPGAPPMGIVNARREARSGPRIGIGNRYSRS